MTECAKSVDFGKDHTSLNIVDWHYRITKKELYQITETISLDDYQQQQQLKWIEHVTQRKNTDRIKMLIFDTTSDKSFVVHSCSHIEEFFSTSRLQ